MLLGSSPCANAAPNSSFELDNLGQYLFVWSAQSPEVAIIDSRSDAPIGNVKLPWSPTKLLIAENARALIASRNGVKYLHVQWLDSTPPVSRISLPFAPERIRLSPDGDTIAASRIEESMLTLLSIREGRTRTVGPIHQPAFTLFNRAGDRLMVASHDARAMSVIDVLSGQVTKQIALSSGGDGDELAIDFARTPYGELGFVVHNQGNRISVLDLIDYEKRADIVLNAAPRAAYPTIDSRFIMVPQGENGHLSFISTQRLTESWVAPGAKKVANVGTARFDTIAFLLDREGRRFNVYDMDRQQIAKRIPLPGIPTDSVVTANGLKVFVSLTEPNAVAVVDTEALTARVIDLDIGDDARIAMISNLGYCH
ncbi:MAG: hypothetical protein AAF493_25155 [Pseudomonadota bacterium]